jgi:hypothetical protein
MIEMKTNTQNIKCGDNIKVLWVLNDGTGQVWCQGVVKKIHRADKKYLVCNIEYTEDDSFTAEVHKGEVLDEKEYGKSWMHCDDVPVVVQQPVPIPAPIQHNIADVMQMLITTRQMLETTQRMIMQLT